MRARGDVDVKELVAKVRTPTLVIHAREDAAVPVASGRQLAALIPGAEFVELDSKNHILLEGEPAWERFCAAIRDFMGIAPAERGEERAFASLTLRERGILALLTEGLSNADIAERLGLSEKTVRNHISNLFDKLGVWTRAQAIVFARDRGFARRAMPGRHSNPRSSFFFHRIDSARLKSGPGSPQNAGLSRDEDFRRIAMANSVEEKVKGIIVEQLGVQADEVKPEASFVDDLGADSLDTVELVMAFEEAFGIEIPDEDAEKIQKVKDAVAYIESHAKPA